MRLAVFVTCSEGGGGGGWEWECCYICHQSVLTLTVQLWHEKEKKNVYLVTNPGGNDSRLGLGLGLELGLGLGLGQELGQLCLNCCTLSIRGLLQTGCDHKTL